MAGNPFDKVLARAGGSGGGKKGGGGSKKGGGKKGGGKADVFDTVLKRGGNAGAGTPLRKTRPWPPPMRGGSVLKTTRRMPRGEKLSLKALAKLGAGGAFPGMPGPLADTLRGARPAVARAFGNFKCKHCGHRARSLKAMGAHWREEHAGKKPRKSKSKATARKPRATKPRKGKSTKATKPHKKKRKAKASGGGTFHCKRCSHTSRSIGAIGQHYRDAHPGAMKAKGKGKGKRKAAKASASKPRKAKASKARKPRKGGKRKPPPKPKGGYTCKKCGTTGFHKIHLLSAHYRDKHPGAMKRKGGGKRKGKPMSAETKAKLKASKAKKKGKGGKKKASKPKTKRKPAKSKAKAPKRAKAKKPKAKAKKSRAKKGGKKGKRKSKKSK